MNASLAAILLWLTPLACTAQGFAGLGTTADGFTTPRPETALTFPADHGAHPDFRIEWWYLTATLHGDDGQDYGVQWTLFRSALRPERDDGQHFLGAHREGYPPRVVPEQRHGILGDHRGDLLLVGIGVGGINETAILEALAAGGINFDFAQTGFDFSNFGLTTGGESQVINVNIDGNTIGQAVAENLPALLNLDVG